MKISTRILFFIALIFFVGCSNNVNTLYYWDQVYPKVVYEDISKNIEPDMGIQILTDYINKAQSTNKQVPPGVYAQIGLFYTKKGDFGHANQYFLKEKELYHESKEYIDFLISKKDRK